MISQKLLLHRGGVIREYKKNQTIFFEGNMPEFYFQIAEGAVKMVSLGENGREFIQGVFGEGQSFGEPVLLINKPYPATAVVTADLRVIKLPREEFLRILKEFSEINLLFLKILANRIYDKAMLSKALTLYNPENRIVSFFKALTKDKHPEGKFNFKVEFSRQAIADMVGFRVETVIRAIKSLERKDLIKIEKGKIYL